jgi:tetratricopeptide (TPR) repeat protein
MSAIKTAFPIDGVDPGFIRGRRLAFVGKLGGINRREANRLVLDCGGSVSDAVDSSVELVIIGANELPLDDHSQWLDDEAMRRVAQGQLEIIGESQLWQELGLVEAETNIRSLYTPAMLAQLADVPLATVRRWQRRGLITAIRQVHKLPYYDYQEVVNARHLAQLIASGASPKSIEDKLSELQEFCADIGRPLSQLSVIVEGRHVFLRQNGGLIEPGGQKRIDFDALETSPDLGIVEAPPRGSISLAETQRTLEQLSTPDEFLTLAMELEDLGENEQAIEVYRSLLLAFGPRADTCFQLAELLYFDLQFQAARERYYMAIELDETFVEARANLGCVLLELGQIEMAISSFQGALVHHSEYPDVHFHLARALDLAEKSAEAVVHWQIFLELSPHSPWADEARQRLQYEQ